MLLGGELPGNAVKLLIDRASLLEEHLDDVAATSEDSLDGVGELVERLAHLAVEARVIVAAEGTHPVVDLVHDRGQLGNLHRADLLEDPIHLAVDG